MPSISTCKANLTKALSAMEAIKGKIPSSLFEKIEPRTRDKRRQLDDRRVAILAHLSDIQAALEIVYERRQHLISAAASSNPSDVDNTLYEAYRQEVGLDAAVVEAESLVAALKASLDEVRSLLGNSPTGESPRASEEQRVEEPRDNSTTASEVTEQNQHSLYPLLQGNVMPSPANSAFTTGPMESSPIQAQINPSLQLGKLTLDPFCGDITQFHRFWCTFELAIHNNANIPPVYKFLYLQSLLKGEAQMVLQDLDPKESNYEDLVAALRRRYDRPHKTRATLHKQLQHMPPSRGSGSELRSTWFRISGIFHGLRRYEDFRNVLPLLDLVKSKFPSEICEKLHDLEYQTNSDFSLDQVMQKLDHIISSKEKYEESTTLSDSLAINTSSCSRSPPRTRSRKPNADTTQCCFCNSTHHSSTRCSLEVPVVVRRNLVKAYGLCWKCIRSGHSAHSCQYPPCYLCKGQHHALLCDSSSSTRRHSRTPSRDRSHRNRHTRYHDPSRYRSSSPRYPSRSPSRERYTSRSSTYSGRSRSNSGERYRADRRSQQQSSSYSRTRSPSRVTFHSPVRHHNDSLRRRSGSPYPSQHHTVESEDESEALQACLPIDTTLFVDKRATQATLMLVKSRAYARKSGKIKEIVLLLDSGAQNSFITSRTVRRLGIEIEDTRPRTFIAFGGQSTTEVSGTAHLCLIDNLAKELVVELTTKEVITTAQYPPYISTEDEKFIVDHRLELPSCRGGPVLPDVLIGIDHYWDILKFGFSLTPEPSRSPTDKVILPDIDDENVIQRLWSLDAIGITDDHDPSVDSALNQRIVEEFNRSARLVDGHLYVRFPWKEQHPPLKDNKRVAYCRLLDQFQRLAHTKVWQQYIKAIEDHIRAGFVEEVRENTFDDPRVYYIPHQAVYKEASSTTKLRVVFDASFKARGAPSLNDCLHQGPTLLPELVGILLRARLTPYLLIADVEKAFHQIRLQLTERDATRFLWLKDPRKPPSSANLRYLRFTRIPFGVNASPFLLAASIHFYLRRQDSSLADEIIRNTYVDNVILGAATEEEALCKYKSVKALFSRMNMNLREFLSNSTMVNQAIVPTDRAIEPRKATLLGVPWIHSRDQIFIPLKTASVQVTTKRSALRALASTFDPLGLLSPFLANVKIFVQDLWADNLHWDTPLSPSMLDRWSQLMTNLSHPLPSIPRLVVSQEADLSTLELCVFGDASKRLYACCAYLVGQESGSRFSNLIMAKSHLNPTKPITIPRAELLAALVSVRLAEHLAKNLHIPYTSIHIFSDSLVALYWIHTPKPLKVFVRNRVETIRKAIALLQQQGKMVKFHYVATGDNPADCATRGLTTKEAAKHVWWNGPSFLRQPEERWPHQHTDFTIPPDGHDSESNEILVQSAVSQNFVSVIPFHRTNSYRRLTRIVAYTLKFIRRRIFSRVSIEKKEILRRKLPSVALMSSTGSICLSDIRTAETQIILAHYSENENELQRLNLHTFNAKRAHDNVIRCPHRIGPLETSPVLILPSHRLAHLLILHFHTTNHHSGIQHTTVSLSSRFFIPHSHSCVAKVLRKCTVCKRFNGYAYRYPDMPALPPERVQRSRPFQNVGIDYLGPLTCTGNSSNKIWICLITCMTTRAVHLEVVLDNSAHEFLLAFRRFVARRGVPSVVYSDNSTTFRAADDTIKEVLQTQDSQRAISQYCARQKSDWRFITPLSPWKGGFYERMVALFKAAYRKSVGRSILPLNHLQAIVVEIEATINSRPITSFRAKDPFAHVLRPIDFIGPDIKLELPDLQAHDLQHALTQQYKELLNLLDYFWELWYTEYLYALRERHQNCTRHRRSTDKAPSIGDVVIVSDEKSTRGYWPYGLIVGVKQGKDSVVRTAQVRMPNGKTLTRSISQLYPLEIQANSPSDGADQPGVDPQPQRVQPSRAAKTAHKYIPPTDSMVH